MTITTIYHEKYSETNMHFPAYIASLQAIALLFCFATLLFSCEDVSQSGDKKIDQLVLTVGGVDTPITFGADYNASLTVPFGTDLTAIMVKTLLVSAKATASVAQGDVLTLTSGSVALTVTAENGNKQIYTMAFTVTPPRTEAAITALTATIAGQTYSTTDANAPVVIMDNAIAITLPVGSPLPTRLSLTGLTLSLGASSVPAEGAMLDLTAGVGTINVTAEDGVIMGVYTVQVTIALARTGAAITALTATISGQAYSTMGANAPVVITDNAIAITLPVGSPLPSSLPLTVLALSSGASSTPAQGATLDLTAGEGTIRVTAEDGTTMRGYTVQVTVALPPRTGTEITALTATTATGQAYSNMGDNPLVVISNNNIAIMLPFGSGLRLSLTVLTLSPGASSIPAQGATLDLTVTSAGTATGMISVQAEDPSVMESYTVSATIEQPLVTTYTGTDTLGIAVRDVVTEAGRSVSFAAMDTVIMVSGLADASFDWALGTLSGTKTATAGSLILTQSDLGTFPAMADVTYAFTVSANGQTSEGRTLFYYPGQVRTWRDLQGVRVDLTGTYRLMRDISFSDDDGDGVSEYNFEPLGRDTDANTEDYQGDVFSGTFDGAGHEIKNVYINRRTEDFVGLFGRLTGTVRNVGLVGGTVTGDNNVGGLVGFSSDGMLQGVYATSAVTGRSFNIGGLAGVSRGTIQGAYATGTVTGHSHVGGLAGRNTGTIRGAYATGAVEGPGNTGSIGGLVGTNFGGTIRGAYATGTVTGHNSVGGLSGYSFGGTIVGYARGNVTRIAGSMDNRFGRLVGFQVGTNTIMGYYSSQQGESQLFSVTANGNSTQLADTEGFDGLARTTASVQADFANFDFTTIQIGQWLFTAGRWPALNLGDLQSVADQPTQ